MPNKYTYKYRAKLTNKGYKFMTLQVPAEVRDKILEYKNELMKEYKLNDPEI